MKKKIILFAYIFFLLFCYCIKNSVITPIEVKDMIIPSTTIVIDKADWQDYFDPTTSDDSLLTFNSEIGTKYSFSTNSIIVSEGSNGILKKITSVETGEEELILGTDTTTITAAINRGEVKASTKLSTIGLNKIISLNKGLKNTTRNDGFDFNFNVILQDQDGDTNTTNDQIILNGSYKIDVIFNFLLKIDNYKVEELEFDTDLNQEAAFNLRVSKNFSLEKEIAIATVEANDIVFFIGEVPIVVVPVFEIAVGIEGQAAGGFEVASIHNAFYNCGASYSDIRDWSPFGSELRNIYSNKSTDIKKNADVKSYISVNLKFKFYNFDGPVINNVIYQELMADYSQTSYWQLYIGTKVGVGMNMDIFSEDILGFIRDDLITYHKKIDEGN